MSWIARSAVVAAGLWLALLCPRPGLAQAPRPGRLIITVVDPLGGLLPSATVTVTGLEDVTRRVTVAPVQTNDRGVATIDGLALGRYAIRVEFAGFDPGLAPDVRVRAGDNRQQIRLPLRRLNEVVTVEQDRQEAAADRSLTFGSALTREQIDALSDDPAELQAQLQAMAGADSVITVDSFEGRRLPDKSQIRSIRISRDQFAAEIHAAGFPRIEVVTQPGNGPFRGYVGGNFYTSALDGSNPLVGRRGPSQNRSGNSSISGTIIPNKLSFNAFFYGASNYSTQTSCRATESGPVCGYAAARTPSRNMQGQVGVEYALTSDRVLGVSFWAYQFRNDNQGIGEYNQIERAFSNRNRNYNIYVSEGGPLGRRFVLNSRFWLAINDSRARSAVEAPTVVILDERTTGGAQRAGGTSDNSITVGSDLDYVRGRHSFRMGTNIDAWWYRSDSTSNYLGTYTFESLEAFEEGRPRSFTRRVGDPLIEYSHVQAAFYIQDDIRLRRNLTITPGVRYELQTHLGDYLNFGPRFGVTWSPFASGVTTLRSSAGVFFDWLNSNTYQQTLQVDGFQQRDVNIVNPSYPDPGEIVAAPVDRYLIAPGATMPTNARVSLGLEQRLGRRLRISQTYAHVRGTGLFVGRNLNAPIDGVRPDPAFANVIEVVTAGRSRQHQLDTNVQLNMAGIGAGPAIPGAGKLWDWRRSMTLAANYTYATVRNDTSGPFATPATGNLTEEWGPAPNDIRHRGNLSFTTQALRNFTARFGVNASSAPPLNIRTGLDDNGDLIFNDRPAGVSRNSERTIGQWTSTASFSYGFTLGTKTVATGSGVSITGSQAGGYTANLTSSQDVPRYRLNVSMNIANLTNRPVYGGYSGVMTSQFFRRATTASGVRRITFNTNVSF